MLPELLQHYGNINMEMKLKLSLATIMCFISSRSFLIISVDNYIAYKAK